MSEHVRALSLQAPPRAAFVQSLARPMERLWAVVLLSVVSGAYLPLLSRIEGSSAAEAEPQAHVVLLPLYACAVPLILTNMKALAQAAWRGKLAVLLVVFACSSTLWSVEPRLSLFRGISLLAPTAVGLLLAVRFTHAEQLRLLTFALGIPAIMSVIVVVLMPEQGVSTIDYGSAWRGVYHNKNGLARNMALAVGVFVLTALAGGRGRRWAWIGAAGTLAIMLLARSVTSLVATAAMLILIPIFRTLRLRSTTTLAVWTISVVGGAAASTAVLANLEPALAVLGRDVTLTGRTDIWAAVVASIAEQPWLGYGHNAFWDQWGPSTSVKDAVGWATPNSHNGLLDLWLDLGFVGVSIYLVGLWRAARLGMASARDTDDAAGVWPLVFLSYMLILNVAEAAVLRQHNLLWIVYVAILSVPVSPALQAALRRAPARWKAERLPGAVRTGSVSPGIRRAFRRREPDA